MLLKLPVLAAGVAVALGAQSARAVEPCQQAVPTLPPAPLQVQLFAGLGIDAARADSVLDNRVTDLFFPEVGGAIHVYGPAWLTLLGRNQSWRTPASAARGQERRLWSAALAPGFRAPVPHGRRLWLRAFVPVGYSWGWIRPGPSRAVHTRYTGGNGFNLGLSGGTEFAGRHHGFYVDFGWAMHVLFFRRTDTAVDVLNLAPGASAHENERFVAHTVFLSAGYEFGW
jgi:hypothetical protein